jgi:6-pyruvoyltetrahydropterin/6-carboxytetrahydropterin synthase
MRQRSFDVRIAKDFHWEMGHRLRFHEGGCQNIHGHSYRMRVELEGVPDEHGMVMDYFILKEVVDPIIEQIDHSFICDEADEPMLELFSRVPMKHVVVPFATTAENITAWLLEQIADALSDMSNLSRLTIRLQETERVYAEMSRPLGNAG